jgi:molybdenum ABC transporter molybdate-binding protein
MPENDWKYDLTIGLRVRVERRGETVLGEGRAELLAAIDRHHSITKAAKATGMSYRRAWTMVQEINAAAEVPLVEASPGGVRGGGARLTSRGRDVLQLYDRIRSSLVQSAAGVLQQAIQSDAAGVVHLAAAISLQEVIGQVLAEFSLARPAVQVRTIFGASNEVADHLLAGAPGDVFITASAGELDRLASAGRLIPTSRRSIAANGLAVVGALGMATLHDIDELLSPRLKRLVLAEPTTPLGRYSRAYLEAEGIYEKLRAKVLHVDNSRAVLAALLSKSAEAGLAFLSDARREGAWRTIFRVPSSKSKVVYEGGLVHRGERSAEAPMVLEFFSSAAARRCLRRCGFRTVKAAKR